MMIHDRIEEIIPGVSLMVEYHSGKAVLIIGEYAIEFEWNEDARALFDNLDNAEPIELLAVIAQTAQCNSPN